MGRLQSSPSAGSPRLLRQRDSPSRQVEAELERQFKHIRLHDEERQRVYIYHRKLLQDELDAKEHAQAAVHKADLDQALAKHEVVRQQAVAVLEAHIKEEEERRRRQQQEEERRRKAEEERRAREREEEDRKAREEQQRKAREAQQKAEAARKAAEEKAKAEREEEERKQREQEAARRAKADADATAAAAAAEKKKLEEEDGKRAAAAAAAAAEKAAAPPTPSSDPEASHKHYLAIHRRLKTFRREFVQSAKATPSLKAIPGDLRRSIKTAVGQLTISDKRANTAATEKIRRCINVALTEVESPPVRLNDYLPPHLAVDQNTTIPALLLYVINIFSKALFEAFTGECSVNTAAADPLGTMAAQIFSAAELQYPRSSPASQTPAPVSLISILIAKFHATAPILFGVSGDENTQPGRARLGWRRQDGHFVLPQVQYDRLVGIAAGYASISLRNFAKAPKRTNPYPPRHFWTSVAHIVNTAPAHVQTPHVLLLRTLLDVGLDRFILFFGADAIAVLRLAVVDLPKALPPAVAAKAEVKSLALLQEKWRKERNFTLAL